MKRNLRIRCHLATQTPAGVTTTFRSHFACFAARAVKLLESSGIGRVSRAGPALGHSYLVIFAKPLIVEQSRYQATCPERLLFHHPSGAYVEVQLSPQYLKCLTCTANGWAHGSLRLLSRTFAHRGLSQRPTSLPASCCRRQKSLEQK